MMDLGWYHKHVAERCFPRENVWIYNGSITESHDDTQTHLYVCRVRAESAKYESRVLFQVFSKDWRPVSEPRFLSIAPFSRTVKLDTGPQDARIFTFDNSLWIVFNMLSDTDGFRRMYLYQIDGERDQPRALQIHGRDYKKTEKNWTPFVSDGRLMFVYCFEPLVILQCNEPRNPKIALCTVVQGNPAEAPDCPFLRGGSPAYELAPGNLVGWLHTVQPPKRTYDAAQLPIAARYSTPHEYRTRKFALSSYLVNPNDPEQKTAWKLWVGEEITFFGCQIEQVYGCLIGDGAARLIVNVNDAKTVLVAE
jgi:hypothetical protein